MIHSAIAEAIDHTRNSHFHIDFNLSCRGDATGTAGTATAVPNITPISSGLERFFYFVGQKKILVGFSSYNFCFKSVKESDPTYVSVH